jgi:hypothetical protein
MASVVHPRERLRAAAIGREVAVEATGRDPQGIDREAIERSPAFQEPAGVRRRFFAGLV